MSPGVERPPRDDGGDARERLRERSLVMSMEEAVRRHIHNGDTVVMGAALEALIPFAAGHEIARQGVGALKLVGPISDMLFDELIGAGCVAEVIAAWVGNVSAGLGHNYRRAAEQSVPTPVQTRDHSNFSITLALLAAGLGVPYLPTRSLLGTDILTANPSLRTAISPFDESPLVLVPALVPDVAVLHVQRADAEGHAHAWGNLGFTREAFLAAKRVVLVTEEVVDRTVILSDPNRILGPANHVVAVVPEPGGAHPSPVQGYYNRDHAAYQEYHQATRELEGWRQWSQAWIYGLPDRRAYLDALGAARCESLRVREDRFAAPVNYGW